LQPTTRVVSRGRKRSAARQTKFGAAIVLAVISVTAQMIALAAATGLAPGLTASIQPKPRMASALIRGIDCGGTAATASTCIAGSKVTPQVAVARVTVPLGSKQCPDSGFGASCTSGDASPVDFGAAAVPTGFSPCPTDPNKPIPNAPGACTQSPAASPAPTPLAGPGALAPAAAKATGTRAAADLQLAVDKTALAAGDHTVLTATSSFTVDGTPWAIEIFDQTTKSVVGACSQASVCTVQFSANAGTHAFVSFVATPTAELPTSGIRLTSNVVNVRWLGVRLATNGPATVGPNHAVTFTALASQDVTNSGYAIELWDTSTGQRLTYCARGLSCSTSLIEPAGGTHIVAADLGLVQPTAGLPAVLARSALVSATWVTVTLAAQTTYPIQGGIVQLTATASADISGTPWAIYIYTAAGALVGSPCNVPTCSASLQLPGGKTPAFYATIAQRAGADAGNPSSTPLSGVLDKVRVSTSKSDVQATSATVTPTRIMWGVDSCAAFTQDPAGSSGLLPQVTSMLGAPDFWGRYLPTTGNCPGLSSPEIAAAHSRHMAILPIYNDYDCSAVSGNAAGSSYGLAAIKWAQNDIIPLGTAIAIDIEPVGDACPGAANVDYGFISGWYDQLTRAGYVPTFYGDTAPGSAFGNAWCSTVQKRPDIANNSFLWSFEPSLIGGYNKGNAPSFSPYNPGCEGKYVVWQYMLSAGSTPDVDHDEATNEFPFWYP
jgi:hypothetical protein